MEHNLLFYMTDAFERNIIVYDSLTQHQLVFTPSLIISMIDVAKKTYDAKITDIYVEDYLLNQTKFWKYYLGEHDALDIHGRLTKLFGINLHQTDEVLSLNEHYKSIGGCFPSGKESLVIGVCQDDNHTFGILGSI